MIYPEVKHSIAFNSIPGQDALNIVLIDNLCSLLMWKILFRCLIVYFCVCMNYR